VRKRLQGRLGINQLGHRGPTPAWQDWKSRQASRQGGRPLRPVDLSPQPAAVRLGAVQCLIVTKTSAAIRSFLLRSQLICSVIAITALSAAPVVNALPWCVLVKTTSSGIICKIATESVNCKVENSLTGFANAPTNDAPGYAHIAWATSSGAFRWVTGTGIGNCGPSYDSFEFTYGVEQHIAGWTIEPSQDGIRFTNDALGRGMFVSLASVYAF